MPNGNSRRRKKTNGAQRSEKEPPAPRIDWFSRFAHRASRIVGKPITFLCALGLVVAWAITGPFVGFSETWQLVINTGTTIITFLIVFLIQNTQNRDTAALQVKLAELILDKDGAPDRIADAEDMSEEQLDRLHREYRARAEHKRRRARKRGTRRAS